MNKITAILEQHKDDGTWSTTEDAGYIIRTEKQHIQLLIENGQSCCEDYGYMVSEDNLISFIGAELQKLEIVDKDRAIIGLEHIPQDSEYYEGGAIFINLSTDKGLLQFVLYNAHNGYYGHDVKVVVDNVTILEDTL